MSVPTLIVTGGPLDGTNFEVDDSPRDRLIGSSVDCDLQILLGNVEPVHAKVARGPRGLLLADGGSATGTYVNGEKIEGDYLLQDGDRICLGPPGSKSSAKLLVKLPPGGAALPLEGSRSPSTSGLALAHPDETLALVEPEKGLVMAPPPAFPPLPKTPAPPTTPPPPPPFAPLASASPPPPAATPRTAPPPPPPAPPSPPPSAPPWKARPEYTDTPGFEPAGEAPGPQPSPAAWPSPKPARPSPLATRPKAGRRVSVPPAALYGALAVVLLAGALAGFKLLWKTPPVLTGVVPERTEPGRTVTLNGENFATDAAGNVVRFGDQTGQVSSASETQLAVTVPAALAAAGQVEVPITVETRGGASKAVTLQVYRAPNVTAVEPEVAMPGDELVLRGQSLGGTPLTVVIGGMVAEVKETQPEQLRVVMPALPAAEGYRAAVSVQVGPNSAKPAEVILGRLPLVLGVSPNRGGAGDRVVVHGRGFDPTPAGNVVAFSGQPALVLAASANELTVAAPTAASPQTQSETDVTVRARGTTSTSSARFVLIRLSSGTYVPRFFAAPVTEYPGDDLAFVSTELGPLLLLGGKAAAPSTAERAVRVAAALNQLVERAGAERPVFELRERPVPGVGVAGSPAPVVTAIAEDAAAYGRGWEAGGKARRVAPRSVATHWTALLQDYFGLFILKQRPLKVLELSSRGKVLSDIYADALRQAGPGNGVPTRIVLPLGLGLARSLREMALVVSDQPPRAAVAVEGRWEGTMEERGAGARKFQVRLRFEGVKLAGSLTTQAGSIEMRAPLREVSYDQGTLRFVVDLSGSPRLFSGPLQADSIDGTIQRTTGDRAAVGRFTLKYAE